MDLVENQLAEKSFVVVVVVVVVVVIVFVWPILERSTEILKALTLLNPEF